MEKQALVALQTILSLKDSELTKEVVESEDFAAKYGDLKEIIAILSDVKKTLEDKVKDVIEPMYAMDGTNSIVNKKYNFSYVAPTVRVTVDSAKLKKDFPDVYKECIKTSSVAATMRVTERKATDGEE